MLRPGLLLKVALVILVGLAAEGQGQEPAKDVHGDPLPDGAVGRLGTVRFRHEDTIVFAAFLPGGKGVLSVSSDGVVCAWEFPSGKQIRRVDTLAGGNLLVTSATLSPDGKHLTAFGDDGFMHILDWANSKEIGKVAHMGGAGSTTRSPTGRTVFRTSLPALSPVYSPDGNTLLVAGSSRVLQFVDLPTAKEVGPSAGHAEGLTAIWFTPDGGQIITKDSRITRTWDAGTCKESATRIIKLPATPGTPTVVTPDGKYGVTVSRFATPAVAQNAKTRDAIIFDATTGKEVGQIGLEVEITPMYRRPLHISPDSKMLAVIAGDVQPKIELHEIPSGKLLKTVDAGPGKVGPGGRFGMSGQKILFGGDSKVLAFQASAGAAIVVLDIVTGKQIGALPAMEGSSPILSAFSPDGRALLLENSDGTVTLIELATGTARCTYGAKLPAAKDPLDDLPLGGFGAPGGSNIDRSKVRVAISPDCKLLALSGQDGLIHMVDIQSAKELTVLKGHRVAVNALAFSPSGKLLASASDDTTALLWDVTKIGRPALPAKAPAAGELEKWWQALADNDAAKAFAAMGQFASSPKEAVAWIKTQVQPATPLDLKHTQELLKELDHEQFKVREKVTAELLKLGEQLVPLLDKALADNPTVESLRRLEDLRGKLTAFVMAGDRLRAFRAVEVLERIGTSESRQVLQALADGAPGAQLTTSAQAALKR
jgi:WD40 repeat protein